MTAVTFDYGQTLGEIDTEFLARRVAERGATVTAPRLEAAMPAAWREYDAAKARGETGFGGWGAFMRALLGFAGVTEGEYPSIQVAERLTEWLWSEQPRTNLWRRPIAGMKGLVQDLEKAGVPLGIVSNSEGKLRELLEEMGLARHFGAIADSGLFDFEKPDRRIFDYVTERLGVGSSDFIHVGDAWVADVEGALGVGGRAVWVTPAPESRKGSLPEGVVACRDAAEIRRALRRFGVSVA